MGKWATYQRRGGSQDEPSAPPIVAPPVFTVDWEYHPNVADFEINCLAGSGPAGAVGITVNGSRNSLPYSLLTTIAFGGTFSTGPFSPGESMQAQAAWADAMGNPLSTYDTGPEVDY